jgi:hypothetical protein
MRPTHVSIKQACAAIYRAARQNEASSVVLPDPETGVPTIYKVDPQHARWILAEFQDRDATLHPALWHKHRWSLPYGFRKLEGAPGHRHHYGAFNRDYEPMYTTDFAYAPTKYPGVWTYISDRHDMVWLYDDDRRSRQDYFRRLARLHLIDSRAWARRDAETTEPAAMTHEEAMLVLAGALRKARRVSHRFPSVPPAPFSMLHELNGGV